MTTASGPRVNRLFMGIATLALVATLGEARASAADVPTSLTLSWLETCMAAGTITLGVNGVTVGGSR